jgi:hypothetical protein
MNFETTQREPPKLITPGVIAAELRTPLHRVLNVLKTRKYIIPSARAGTLRLYSRNAIAMVRYELNLIDARRCRKEVNHAIA